MKASPWACPGSRKQQNPHVLGKELQRIMAIFAVHQVGGDFSFLTLHPRLGLHLYFPIRKVLSQTVDFYFQTARPAQWARKVPLGSSSYQEADIRGPEWSGETTQPRCLRPSCPGPRAQRPLTSGVFLEERSQFRGGVVGSQRGLFPPRRSSGQPPVADAPEGLWRSGDLDLQGFSRDRRLSSHGLFPRQFPNFRRVSRVPPSPQLENHPDSQERASPVPLCQCGF